MAGITEDDCKRYKIYDRNDHWYLVPAEKALMSFYPDETGEENADMKVLLNYACRMTSKALSGEEVTWEMVEDQLRKSGYGSGNRITDRIADAVKHWRENR